MMVAAPGRRLPYAREEGTEYRHHDWITTPHCRPFPSHRYGVTFRPVIRDNWIT